MEWDEPGSKRQEALSQELLSLLNEATTLVTISEGVNRQIAAEHITRQLADYFVSHPYRLEGNSNLSMIFDEGIISDPNMYDNFRRNNFPRLLSNANFRSVKSHESPLIQLADVAAGFNRLVTDISLGHPNKQIEVLDDRPGIPIKMDLRSYICLSQRWNTWGEVPPPPDPENVTFDGRWPFKYVGGHGLRIVSSVSADLVNRIYDSRIVYMGLHARTRLVPSLCLRGISTSSQTADVSPSRRQASAPECAETADSHGKVSD